MKQQTTKNGYKEVTLHDQQGVKHRFYVHRLVWTAYKGRIPKGYEIDHINGDRADNRLESLRLVSSHKENCANPSTLARFKESNALSKGKWRKDRILMGMRRTDKEICTEYVELSKQGKCGVWRLMNKAHCGYGRAVRIVQMMEGEKGKGD